VLEAATLIFMRLSVDSRHVRRAVAATACAVQLACGGSPASPSKQTSIPARIDVVAAASGSIAVAPGATLQLKAVAVDSAGGQTDVTGTATWRSSDPEKAVVTPSGLVKGGKDGTVDVSATLDGITGTAAVAVRPASPSCAAARLGAGSALVTPFNNLVSTSVVTPSSDCRWTAASDSSWLNPGDWTGSETGTGAIYDPGRSGDGTFSYTASANRTLAPRTAHVRVSFTDGTVLEYVVSQAAPTCVITIVPGERHLPYAQTSGSVDVHVSPSTCSWTSWIDPRISPVWNVHVSGGGVGDGTLSYSANPTPTNLTSIAHWFYAYPSNPLDPPAVFVLYLGGR
jgi:hypothetical protein